MTTEDPFSGMNPFFEQQWRDAHTRLVKYLRDASQERLPEDLMARTEEEVVTIGAGGPPARLPAIRVPLGPTDADVVVDLQPLIDQCHERGRYHLLNYRLDLDPPLSPEEADWVSQVLREHALG